ncbi:Uncharacterised protein [Mycobacteroides abscessus subsp. abscessus]|nr:Uncharacterised protein [Mycobacteroides abscessus subsp. abscessus]
MCVQEVQRAHDARDDQQRGIAGDVAGTMRELQPAHRRAGERAGRELHDNARQPAPRGVELPGQQQEHHGRQGGQHGQHHQAAGARRMRHPEDDQDQAAEEQVRQPFCADRPSRAVPAGQVEVRTEPQLHHEQLAHIVGGVKGVDAFGHVPDVHGEDHPQGRQVHGHQVDGPDSRQAQPQKVQGFPGGPAVPHPVQVVPGQHESAEDEKEIDALSAAVEDGVQRGPKFGGCLLE